MEYMSNNYFNEMHDMRPSFAVAVLLERYGGMLSKFDFFFKVATDHLFFFLAGWRGGFFPIALTRFFVDKLKAFILVTKNVSSTVAISPILACLTSVSSSKYISDQRSHTGKCIRRFGGIYAYCRYFIDRKW